MTDNEIIKALHSIIDQQKAEIECLQNELSVAKLKNSDLQSTYQALKIDLESMRSAANSYKMHYEESQAEIEMLNEKYSRMKFNLESVLAERSDHTEAIKEFAEMLKEKGTPVTGGKGFEGVYVMCSNTVIDNLVKEMEGELHDGR